MLLAGVDNYKNGIGNLLEAKARYLVLNHIAPALTLPGLEKAFLGDAAAIYGGPLRVAADGDFFSMPSGSTDISFLRRF